MKAIEQVILIENAIKDLDIQENSLMTLIDMFEALKDQLHDDRELRKFLAMGKR